MVSQVETSIRVAEIFAAWLKENHQRMTPERMAILLAIYERSDHFDADTLLSDLRKSYQNVSRETIVFGPLRCGLKNPPYVPCVRHQIACVALFFCTTSIKVSPENFSSHIPINSRHVNDLLIALTPGRFDNLIILPAT